MFTVGQSTSLNPSIRVVILGFSTYRFDHYEWSTPATPTSCSTSRPDLPTFSGPRLPLSVYLYMTSSLNRLGVLESFGGFLVRKKGLVSSIMEGCRHAVG